MDLALRALNSPPGVGDPSLSSLHQKSDSAPPELDDLCASLQHAFRPARLSVPAVLALAHFGRAHRLSAKTPVLHRGADANALWLLSRGEVSVGNYDPSGQWWQTRAVEAGEWIDVASAWLGGPYLESAIAETTVTVHELSVTGVEAACRDHPEIARQLLACVSARVRRATQDAHDLLVKDVTARMAGWLLAMLPSDGGESQVVLRQPKRSLASQLGTSPETLSRTLKRLRETGLIDIHGRRIRVHDVQGLRKLAEMARPRAPCRGLKSANRTPERIE